MTGLPQDLRFSARLLRKSPGLTAVAVLSLGLGIGANTTIYSVLHGILVRPDAFAEPDRLVSLWEHRREMGNRHAESAISSALEWRRQNDVFEGIEMCTGGAPLAVTGPGAPERVQAQHVTPGLFALLGVQPELGRTFALPSDISAVLLSHNYWDRRFNRDPAAIGKVLMLDGEAHTILGVMPPGFQRLFTDGDADLWLPIDLSLAPWRDRSTRLITLARLKPAIGLAQARAEMATISRRIEQTWPETHRGWTALVLPLREAMSAIWRPVLDPLFGAVVFVLLIACANVSNLLLARSAARRKEIAIRAALGAGRFRLIRQLLLDALALAIPGGLLGLLLAAWGIRLWLAASPPWFPSAREVTIERAVLLFTFCAAVLSGITLGLLPAFRASGPDLTGSLKQGGRISGASRHRARNALVIAEVALAVVLLTGAGLMVRTFLNLNPADRGFRADHILTAQIELSGPSGFYRTLAALEALPGVESAALATGLPEGGSGTGFLMAGQPLPRPEERPRARLTTVSPEFFRTFGIPLREGRALTAADTADAPWVAVVNEALARRYFPGQDPLGRYLTLGPSPAERPRQIVGVVGDIRPVASLPPAPRLYIALPRGATASGSLAIALHTTIAPEALEEAVRKTIASIAPTEPLYDVRTMDQVLASRKPRLSLGLFAGLACLALLLAVIGIHGVISWTVADRVHELGVRVALGAGRGRLIRLVVWEGVKFALVGIAAGLAAAYALCRLMYDFLVGVRPTDPATYAVVSVILLGASLLATVRPAFRAARMDLARVLRAE